MTNTQCMYEIFFNNFLIVWLIEKKNVQVTGFTTLGWVYYKGLREEKQR